MRRAALALAVVLVVASAGCGYRVVQRRLPSPSIPCVRFEGLTGGAAHPKVAVWTGAALREEVAPDLCPAGGGGPILVGEVEAVEPAAGHFIVGGQGAERAGGRWIARASISIVDGDSTLWGPLGVEVERDFLSTGSTMVELDALDAHLRLLSEDLARGLADVLYGVHPVTIEASD